MNMLSTAIKRVALLLLLYALNAQAALTGPETTQLLNNRYQSTTTTCAASKPAWYCNGVLVKTRTPVAGQPFWQHDSNATALGAEGVVYLRKDLGISQLTQANGVIFSDLFTAIGEGKTLDVLCAYPFTQELDASRSDYGCALMTSATTADVSSCAALGVTDSPTWLAHFQQSGNQPAQQCSLSSLLPQQFDASLKAHRGLGSEWSARANRLQVRNWDASIPQRVPVQALFYDINQVGTLTAAQKDQRDYFNATGQWLPVLRMNLNDSDGQVFGFNGQDQLYVGYAIAAGMNARYTDTRPECSNQQAAYFCNGILFRSNAATTAFHAWDPSPGSVRNNGVSFSYIRSDIVISSVVYNRHFGFTFKELAAPAVYTPTLRCAYPYDAGTSGSPDPCTFRQVCSAIGITSVDLWLARYRGNPILGCAFSADAEQFQLSIDVRKAIPNRVDWNEIMLAAWPLSIPNQLPLESLYYQSDSGGLPNAQFIQNDYFQQTGRFLPIMTMNLGAPGGVMFSYDPAQQLAPGAPSLSSFGTRPQSTVPPP
ncbi:hypothetical protein [Pseudomonas sp. LP_7_YM]|uniref:hypothetical protein n=1 Tax=Pseudomonas sp. LP_7_YM TaxID=2485137 RepID=UPI00105D9BE3|nr:hypothetical protein [Pseudomonas sp. LP_7_YM]TDV60048.1 hypothetical protein EC915_11311 [Pseudomonas sp. LP_7_YM]